ncbi:hypothetical protein J5N97_024589 [Dioscorea zingiberensis]|uniref:Uncharacterized protein n=1 Tax=Dioscorea zingiberensis TaxID=325984 RepID=A0A9D5C6Q0_9LILI|nr:hypothetical protein J5N97_024589 [Dioscorea zingiberensis]
MNIEVSTLAHSMLADLHNNNNNYGKAIPGHIPRVPPNIRNINRAAYDPKVLSIGPYHHGKPGLQAMEDHKKRYLREFLTYMPGELEKLEKLNSLIYSVRTLEEKLLSLYNQPLNIERDDFIKMIVLDGCFILRLLIKIRVRLESEADAIFEVVPLLRRDLLLLENQLPFFILEKLYELIPKPNSIQPFPTLKEMAFAYLTMKLSTDPIALNNLEAYHLLHFYDLILLPKPRDHLIFESNQNAPSTVPQASKQEEPGIKITAKKADNFLEVPFVEGKLQISCLEIKDVAIPIFRNLIAFEQCCPTAGNHLTDTRFMDLMV